MSIEPEEREVGDSTQENSPEGTRSEVLARAAHSTSRKLLTLIGVGGILFFVVHVTPIGQQVRDWDALAEILKVGGFRADMYYVLICAFLIMVGVPRLLLCAIAGFVFGFWEGLLWSSFGSLVGSFAAFRAARWGGREWLVTHFGGHPLFGRIIRATPTIISVALIRMLPVSNAVVNVGLALGHVENRAFLLGSLLGFLPQGVIAVVIGSGMAEEVPWAGAVQIGIAALLLLVAFLWTSRKRQQAAADAIQRQAVN